MTGFSNSEEAAVGLTQVVPFLVEDMLKQNGGNYSKGDDRQPYVRIDENLVTGQNPKSSEGAVFSAHLAKQFQREVFRFVSHSAIMPFRASSFLRGEDVTAHKRRGARSHHASHGAKDRSRLAKQACRAQCAPV